MIDLAKLRIATAKADEYLARLRDPDFVRRRKRLYAATCDSDGTATAALCEDIAVPQDCQARAESIAQRKP